MNSLSVCFLNFFIFLKRNLTESSTGIDYLNRNEIFYMKAKRMRVKARYGLDVTVNPVIGELSIG